MAELKKPTTAPPESGEKPKKEAPAVVAANEDAEKGLKKASKPEKERQNKKEEPIKKPTEKQKEKPTEPKKPEPAKPEKKEKNWKIGLGTTEVANADHSMEVSTTGLKFENEKKSLEFTLGAATITETVKPGTFPEKKTMPGFSVIKRF